LFLGEYYCLLHPKVRSLPTALWAVSLTTCTRCHPERIFFVLPWMPVLRSSKMAFVVGQMGDFSQSEETWTCLDSDRGHHPMKLKPLNQGLTVELRPCLSFLRSRSSTLRREYFGHSLIWALLMPFYHSLSVLVFAQMLR